MTADAAAVAAALAASLWLGARAPARGGAADFILASRALTLPAFVATLVPTFYGGALGVGEFAWGNGLSNWTVMAAPYYICAALYALWLAGRVRRAAGLTIPDHIEAAFGRPPALLAAALVFLLACPADELLMSAALLSHATGLPPGAAAAGAAVLSGALLWRGGLPSDARANRLQMAVMYAGFALILPFCLLRLGPPSSLPDRLPPGHLTWTGGLGWARLLSWWLLASWTFVDPAFHQRCAAAESPETARAGILVSIGFWALFDAMTTAAGLYARAALPSLEDPVLAFPRLAEAVLPAGARGLFLAGLACSVFAGLQAAGLAAATALGRDLWGRLRPAGEEASRSRLRAGLAAALALAWVLARLLPSVAGLWYAVGSACVPGLLLPLLGAYAPAARPSPAWALSSSAAGFCVALAWVLAWRLRSAPPLGLEPMLAGLAASGALWAAGLAASGRGAKTAAAA